MKDLLLYASTTSYRKKVLPYYPHTTNRRYRLTAYSMLNNKKTADLCYFTSFLGVPAKQHCSTGEFHTEKQCKD